MRDLKKDIQATTMFRRESREISEPAQENEEALLHIRPGTRL
jgi:hypothetical protein